MNELRIGITLNYAKGGAELNINKSATFDSANALSADNIQKVGTVEESVFVGDVTNAIYVFVQNTDTTNYVQIGTAADEYSIRLKPGQFAIFPPDASTLKAKANVAECAVRFAVVSA
jgi:hypothetical protein